MALTDITTGTTLQQTYVVETMQLADKVGSGLLPVLATPALIAWMENTAMQAVAPFLTSAETTVGISIAITHLKASPLNATITCHAMITEVDGRRIRFEVNAYDADQHLIGEGTHERFVVDRERFMAKLS
ncbi:thioesterase family protein [Microbacter margulisiae]|uniref:Putative thioesterase n=1 Tax=Microbacter margulisiae TaxID=1350067 RepID=A0A7W5DRU5_9PORP|nr:putative thioesterase [Microbacter margulisiae]